MCRILFPVISKFQFCQFSFNYQRQTKFPCIVHQLSNQVTNSWTMLFFRTIKCISTGGANAEENKGRCRISQRLLDSTWNGSSCNTDFQRLLNLCQYTTAIFTHIPRPSAGSWLLYLTNSSAIAVPNQTLTLCSWSLFRAGLQPCEHRFSIYGI